MGRPVSVKQARTLVGRWQFDAVGLRTNARREELTEAERHGVGKNPEQKKRSAGIVWEYRKNRPTTWGAEGQRKVMYAGLSED